MNVSFGEVKGSVQKPIEEHAESVEPDATEEEPQGKTDLRAEFIKQAITGTVVLGERTFKYSIPGPFDGCAIDNHLCAYRAPFQSIVSNPLLPVMPADVLKEFMKATLKNCAEILPSGSPAPVVDEDGEIGINNSTGPLLATLAEGYILFFVRDWVKGSPLLLNPEM